MTAEYNIRSIDKFASPIREIQDAGYARYGVQVLIISAQDGRCLMVEETKEDQYTGKGQCGFAGGKIRVINDRMETMSEAGQRELFHEVAANKEIWRFLQYLPFYMETDWLDGQVRVGIMVAVWTGSTDVSFFSSMANGTDSEGIVNYRWVDLTDEISIDSIRWRPGAKNVLATLRNIKGLDIMASLIRTITGGLGELHNNDLLLPFLSAGYIPQTGEDWINPSLTNL